MIPFIKPILSLDHSNLGNMGCFSSKPLAPGLEREGFRSPFLLLQQLYGRKRCSLTHIPGKFYF